MTRSVVIISYSHDSEVHRQRVLGLSERLRADGLETCLDRDGAHLYRARLFGDRAALAEARRLIDKHGYGRRREELADAEAAGSSS